MLDTDRLAVFYRLARSQSGQTQTGRKLTGVTALTIRSEFN